MKKLNIGIGSVFLGIILAVLLLSVGGWAECWYTSDLSRDNICDAGGVSGCGVDNTTSICYSTQYSGLCSMTQCGSASNQFKDIQGGTTYFLFDCDFYGYGKLRGTVCDKCGADSLVCVSAGNSWQPDQSASCGKSCKINNCKAADSTWLSTSIAACTGINNYAIVNTDSTCEHVGACCNGLDSIPEGNTCKWRCDSVLTQCNGRSGALFGAVLPDTSVSGQDTTFSYQCYYNCSHSPNPDSSVYLVEGNIVLGGPNDSIPDGIKSETFNSVRTTTGGVYIYDYLSPAASEYIDSIATVKCVEHLWRCVINNKYVYWYDNQEVPAGCTNIVRVK